MTKYDRGLNKADLVYLKIIFHRFAAESDKNNQLLQGGSMKGVLNPTPPE
jgi:hypothetical protein